MGVVGIKVVTCGELDPSRPIVAVKGTSEARHIGREAVAIGCVIQDRCMAEYMRDVMIIVGPVRKGSIFARNGRGGCSLGVFDRGGAREESRTRAKAR